MARNHSRTTRWTVILLVVLLLIAVAGTIFFQFSRPVVTVTDVVQGPVVRAFYATGTVQPVREYPIKSNIAGVLKEVKVDKGDAVKKDQLLAVVEDPEIMFRFNKAQAELTEKLARSDQKTSPVLMELESRISALGDMRAIAQREVARYTELVNSRATSQSDLDRATDKYKQVWSEHESLKSQLLSKKLELNRDAEVAKAALDTAKWNLEQQTLRSPVDGVVLDRPLSLGTRVAVNDHVMQVADVRAENLVVRAAVDEEDKATVALNQSVRMVLYAFPDRAIEGKVTRIYDKADAERRTFEIDVQVLQKDLPLAPGMTGELAFVVEERARTRVVPAQAVQNGNVYLVRDGKIVKTDAKIGVKSIERAEVLSGVEEADQVVISPIGTIEPGTAVRTKSLDPQSAAGLNKKAKEEQAFKGLTK